MSVVECDVPSQSALGADLIEHADFRDAYRAPLRRSELSSATLRQNVTSPGGTTVLNSGTGYIVTATSTNGDTYSIQRTANGVLTFQVSAGGQVTP